AVTGPSGASTRSTRRSFPRMRPRVPAPTSSSTGSAREGTRPRRGRTTRGTEPRSRPRPATRSTPWRSPRRPPNRRPVPRPRRRYEANRSTFQQEEQVRARHILFSTRGATPEVEKKTKARADSLLAAIRQQGNVDFEALAKSLSEDPSAVATGGDLGWFGRK